MYPRSLPARRHIMLLAIVGLTCLGDCSPARSSEPAEPAPAGKPLPERPKLAPPASAERAAERARMVDQQIAGSFGHRRSVRSAQVLEAMRTAPRHVFLPPGRRGYAYADSPVPIGYGQTISQPYIVAYMTDLLEASPETKVLEIGTGSGYQAAVLAHLTDKVYSVEIIEPLAKRAQQTLSAQGYTAIQCLNADGYYGWAEHAPYDRVIVTCAAGHLPAPLWEQLRPGGKIVIPIGGPKELQHLVVITKTADGKRRSRRVMPVRFVPLTRGKDK